MLNGWKSRLLVIGWGAFLGAFTFLAATDFAIISGAGWCGSSDQLCLREWIGALSGWAATIVAGGTFFLLVRQLVDSTRAVEIASETLNDNRLSAERQQRAYVYAGQTRLTFDSGFANITLEVTNHGQTPARGVSVQRMIYIAPKADLRDMDETTTTTLGDLAPSQMRFSRTTVSKNAIHGKLAKIARGETRIHCYVKINYTDIFDRARETTFRLISPIGPGDGFMLINEAVRSN